MSERIVCDGVPESLIHIDALFIEFRSKDVRRPRLYHARADWGRHCGGFHRRVLGRANMVTWWCVVLFARALNQDLDADEECPKQRESQTALATVHPYRCIVPIRRP